MGAFFVEHALLKHYNKSNYTKENMSHTISIQPIINRGCRYPKFKIGVYFFVLALFFVTLPTAVSGLLWKQLKGKHFIVNYDNDEDFARQVLDRAEKYYDKVADTLGYPRYSDFWTWNNRVNIYVYPDKTSFILGTGQAEWVDGKADYKNMEISIDATNPKFLDNILPHEIAHLVFRDFVGFAGDIPIWLDEGVATIAQEQAYINMKEEIKNLYQHSALLTLNDMMTVEFKKAASKPTFHNILMKDDSPGFIVLEPSDFITVFYSESASLVDYMMTVLGKENFSEFCRHLRDGKTIDEALKKAYGSKCSSLDELEAQWRKHLASQ